jgi:hypothetical protein
MPRPRRPDHRGKLAGAVLGALITGGAGGALVGGLIGSAGDDDQPLPLEDALREALSQRSLELLSFTRVLPTRLQILYRPAVQRSRKRRPNWFLQIDVPAVYGDSVELDDALFDDVLRRVDGIA